MWWDFSCRSFPRRKFRARHCDTFTMLSTYANCYDFCAIIPPWFVIITALRPKRTRPVLEWIFSVVKVFVAWIKLLWAEFWRKITRKLRFCCKLSSLCFHKKWNYFDYFSDCFCRWRRWATKPARSVPSFPLTSDAPSLKRIPCGSECTFILWWTRIQSPWSTAKEKSWECYQKRF